MEDSKIVDLFLSRNEKAITEAAKKYGRIIRKIATSITEDSFLAEECENDTYLTAWNLIPPNEPRSYLSAFLTKIARNISLDKCRARRSAKRMADTVSLDDELAMCLPDMTDTSNEVDSRLLGDAISKFLKDEPKEKRMIFIRRYWYQDSISEISLRMSISESKVKVSLHRTREKLKKYLKKEGYTV